MCAFSAIDNTVPPVAALIPSLSILPNPDAAPNMVIHAINNCHVGVSGLVKVSVVKFTTVVMIPVITEVIMADTLFLDENGSLFLSQPKIDCVNPANPATKIPIPIAIVGSISYSHHLVNL